MVFDVYFASIVSMAHCHPGAGRKGNYDKPAPKLSLEECADVALKMLAVRRRVMGQ